MKKMKLDHGHGEKKLPTLFKCRDSKTEEFFDNHPEFKSRLLTTPNKKSRIILEGVHTNKKVAVSKPFTRQARVDMHFKQAKSSFSRKETGQKRNSAIGREKNKSIPLFSPSVVERRMYSISTKLLTSSDPCFNRFQRLFQLEEQEINRRADMYANSTLPDCDFYVLPENVCEFQPLQALSGKNKKFDISCGIENSKERDKRKRKSYSNIDCFVTYSKRDDTDESNHSLPTGTKLLKPPKKLVELVAEAVDDSPDGLLQVQQIYTVLQNKFPYFRYMDKSAINSWRSSIRHALYQKWFKKIRFSTEGISAKGCFWAINRRISPSEWIIPYTPNDEALRKHGKPKSTVPFLDMLLEPKTEEEEYLKEVIQIAKEYGISFPDCVAEAKSELLALKKLNVPSPVKDPDPILVACVPCNNVQTQNHAHGQFNIDEGLEELPFTRTPLKVLSMNDQTSDGGSVSVSPVDDSLISWTSPSLEELPILFSSPYCLQPYGLPVFPDHSI